MIALLAAASLCAERSPCRVAETFDAGKGLQVVRLALYEGGSDRELPEPDMQNCKASEYWLVKPQTLLLRICNDGYGASGVGEDAITVKPNRFIHEQNGGSAWRWSRRREISLSPLALIAESGTSMWNVDLSYEGGSTLDWKTLGGKATETARVCGDESEAPKTLSAEWLPLPTISGDFDWKTTALGECGVAVDGSKNGFITHGVKGASNDAAMKIAIAGKRVIVEITDDVPVPKADSWVKEDHLEVWNGPHPDSQCVDVKAAGAIQWAIRLDGTVIPAHGGPDPIAAEVASGAGWRRFSFEAPADYEALTVVYSDSDDGKKQERLLATSNLQFAKLYTLGRTGGGPKLECTAKNGALVRVSSRKPTEPFLADE